MRTKGLFAHSYSIFLLLLVIISPVLLNDSQVAVAEGEGYPVVIFAGFGSKTSKSFIISDPQFRIDYSYITSNPTDADFQIFVYQMSVPFEYIDFIQESGESKIGYKDIFAGNDTFFIAVSTYEIESWEVSISQQNIPVQTPSVEYTPLVSFNGTSGMTTPTFHIPSDHFIVNWNYTTDHPTAGFFALTYVAGEIENYLTYLGDFGPGRSDIAYIYTGNFTDFYFLIVTDVNVTFWDLNLQVPNLNASSITCSAMPTTAVINNSVGIRGSIIPAQENKIVTLTFTDPNNTTFSRTILSGSDGSYSYTINPDMYGSYKVRANWSGDETHAGATSYLASFNVTKLLSDLTCNTSKSEYRPGEAVNISGVTYPKHIPEVTLTIVDPNNHTTTKTIETGPDGVYNLPYYSNIIGSYSVRASWPGDETYEGAISPLALFNITLTKIPTSLTCQTDKTEYHKGDAVNIQGALNPPLSGRSITLTITRPDKVSIVRVVTTEPDGSYVYTFLPVFLGSWSVKADFPTDLTYEWATSYLASFNVSKLPSTLTCSAVNGRNAIHQGGTLDVSGILSPPLSGKNITLTLSQPNNTTIKNTVTTNANGSYDFTYTLVEKGDYKVQASWPGDETYEGATSPLTPLYAISTKISMSIECQTDKETYNPGTPIKVSGVLSTDIRSRIVTLTFTKPDNTTFIKTVRTGLYGSYSYTYTSWDPGSHKVQASYPGDEVYEGVTSKLVQYRVRKIAPTLTCTTISTVETKQPFIISGVFDPPIGGKKIYLTFTENVYGHNVSWNAETITKEDGTYSLQVYAVGVGQQSVEAYFIADEKYNYADSLPVEYTVTKRSSKLSLTTPRDKIKPGGKADIQGILSHNPPLPGKNVTLTITNPDATKNNLTFITDSSGIFNHEFQPEEHGKYEFQASWSGDATYKTATSQQLELTVEQTQSGIPGFPIESIILSIIFASVIIWVINKRT